MSIAEKLVTVAENVQKVYDAGYEKGKAEGGGSDDFIGIKYSDFDNTTGSQYNLPTVADARSLESVLVDTVSKERAFMYAFYNQSANANGGYFTKLKKVFLPYGATHFNYTFDKCTNLTEIIGDLSSITYLNYAFRQCSSLKKIPYMPNLKLIEANSFASCTGLASINFYTKPTTFASTALSGCSNLLDIYVPWSEGEVANAPWGAINATIHYNTQFDENHNPIISEV